MNEVRKLRNRIMHHEPIYYLDLPRHHERVYRVLGHLSAHLPQHAGSVDRFPVVWRQRPAGADT